MSRFVIKSSNVKANSSTDDLKMIRHLAAIILIPCVGLIAGQSTSLNPTSNSIQQTVTMVLNHTATTQTTYSTHETSPVKPSSVMTIMSHHSSVPSTPPTTTATNDKEEDKEEKAKKKNQTAIIAASCSGGAVLIIGLTLIICTHRKNHHT